MKKYYRKKKKTLREKVLRVAALLILLAPAVNCDAEGVKAPTKRITIQDAINAAIALVKMEPEVPNICRVELVEINGNRVYRPVEANNQEKTEKE